MATYSKLADHVERDRPWKQEGDFQIENNEEDCDEVIADVELGAGILKRLETALVRREFLVVLAAADQ